MGWQWKGYTLVQMGWQWKGYTLVQMGWQWKGYTLVQMGWQWKGYTLVQMGWQWKGYGAVVVWLDMLGGEDVFIIVNTGMVSSETIHKTRHNNKQTRKHSVQYITHTEMASNSHLTFHAPRIYTKNWCC